MDKPVSVFVPVHNAQAGLESQVERILDLLPELANRFDVLIIDDGSTDDTADIARDLAARYPQVETIRHDAPRGIDEAIRTGLKHRPDGVVVVHTEQMPLDAGRLRRFCGAKEPQNAAVAARPTTKTRPTRENRAADLSAWVDRLMGWGAPWPTAD